jgi:hypothetical protein
MSFTDNNIARVCLALVAVAAGVLFIFASPSAQQFSGGVRGTVLLAPVCPVNQNVFEAGCETEPYATHVSAFGIFELQLPPGEYRVAAAGGAVFPACRSVAVSVPYGAFVEVLLHCDTGIR